MQYKELGNLSFENDSLRVSSLGLGCMGMSEFYGKRNDAQSMQVLNAALNAGINFFDTADTYGLGHNEELLGRFIKNNSSERGRMVIATKFGIVRHDNEYQRRIDNTPEYIFCACDKSLDRLGLDCIDLYYCHRRNPNTSIDTMMNALKQLVQEGKVRGIGLSEVSSATLRKAHAIHPITAVQSEYSLWSRQPEQELLATCKELGVSFVAYSPLGRAFLTGNLEMDKLDPNDFRRFLPRLTREALQENKKLLDEFSRLSKQWGLSNAQVCLAWLLNKHPHVIPIIGMRRLNHLQDNVRATQVKLTLAQINALDELFLNSVKGARYPEAGWAGIEQDK